MIAIGELGSFSKAAERLNLSPPAVFAHIQQLETELGEKLYERSGRKLVLTPAGRLMIEYCRSLLRVHDEAITAVRELSGVHRGSLYLGCGPHISVAIVPHLLRAYLARHPNVELRLITGNDHMLFEDLYAGRVDLILMNLPVEGDDLVQDPLWRYEMVFIVPPGDPLGASDTASVADLQERPFILYQRAVVIESAIRQFCVAAGFEPKVVMQNDQADSIKELVKLGLGISLLPLWSVSDDIRRGTLKLVRLSNRQLFSVTGLIYRKTPHLPKAVQSLIEVSHEWKNWVPQAEDLLEIAT
ncbi:MAG TPA: LysR family transcriptional regulator [Candidatus Limnocylindrales bacterium]|nr:LysR family transcriptional regulator [Candidatus Limnocylindrales bacterium]